MQTVREFWPIYVFVLGVVFSLGRYEFMLSGIKEKFKILFRKNEEIDDRVNSHDTQIEVTKEKLSNIETSLNENKKLSMAILNEIRNGNGRTRHKD